MEKIDPQNPGLKITPAPAAGETPPMAPPTPPAPPAPPEKAPKLEIEIGLSKEEEEKMEKFKKAAPAKEKKGFKDRWDLWNSYFKTLGRIHLKDKMAFFQLLSVMIGAGVPLIKALLTLSEQLSNPRLRKISSSLAEKVEKGKSLSEAMEKFPSVFSEAHLGMVQAGEASGKLNETLYQIARQEEKTTGVAMKVKGAMIYPAVIILILIGAVLIMFTLVIPRITQLFSAAGGELPSSTRFLLNLSNFTQTYWSLILFGLVILVGLLWLFKKTPSGKFSWDLLMLKIPVLGDLRKKVALARFARTLAGLMQSGIAIVKALQINANAIGNEVYRKRILLAAEDVASGIPLAENLTDSRALFPEMLVSMIAVGEQTAELSKVADKIADFYDEEIDVAVNNLSKLIEPLILVIMGVVVGGLVIAIMQPILNLTEVVGVI